MAKILPLMEPCKLPDCKRVATHRVYDLYDTPIGDFCLKHGNERFEEMQKRHE